MKETQSPNFYAARSAVALVAAFMLLRSTHAGAQQTTGAGLEIRHIAVSGTGSVEAQPDLAYVTIGVETEAEQAQAAMNQNNQQMQALTEALKAMGIAERNIQTRHVSLQPRYAEQQPRTVGRGRREVAGYTAMNTVEVRIEEIARAGELIDAAVQAGGNRVQSIRFEVSESDRLLQKARQDAWQDALGKAQQLAKLAGAELGHAITITTQDQSPFPVMQRSVAARAEAAAVPIQPGTQEVTATVHVTWALR